MTTNFHTILVSAFITGTNARADRSIDKYIELGRPLLETNIPKIVFLSSDVFSRGTEKWMYNGKKYKWTVNRQTNTYCIEFNMRDMYYHGADMSQFGVNTGRPDKDTAEYMMVQNYKPEWMRMAVMFSQTQMAVESHVQYMWVDFGIRHMFQDDEHLSRTLDTCVSNIDERFKAAWDSGHPMDAVHFASCHPEKIEWLDVYRDIQWVFAGSVFGGLRGPILRLAELAKAECERIIRERKGLMWEVNVWILIKEKNPLLFSQYRCAHDPSILLNF
jgi:hypothetical protein